MKQYYKKGKGKEEFYNGVIVLDNMQVINPSEDQIKAAGYTEYFHVPTLDEVRANKLADITAYDESKAVNLFTMQGIPMWLDFEERARLRISLSAYTDMGKTDMKKIFNGKEFNFSLDQWKQMLAAIEVYASEALNVTEMHKLSVNKLESIEAVERYDYKTGYPEKLIF